MRFTMLKDILFGSFLLGSVGFAAVDFTQELGAAMAVITPCQDGYRGAVPGSCTRPLAPPVSYYRIS